MAMADGRTVAFWGRLGVSAAVFGSVFLLATASTSAVRSLLVTQELRDVDEPLRRSLVNTDLFTPVEQRIRERELLIGKLHSPAAKKEEERKLASLYQELGKRSFDLNQLPRAEEAYQKSVALDPDNPKYLGDLAQLYAAAAVRQAEAKQRVALLRNSSECYQSAATSTSDPEAKRVYNESAANAMFGAALELSNVGQPGEAREELFRARSLVPNGSTIASQIDAMLGRVGG